MERLRSVSESHSQSSRRVCSRRGSRRNSSEFSSLCNSEAVAAKILPEYRFQGQIVTYRPAEHFGFIRSSQVEGDIFFGLNHITFKSEDPPVTQNYLLHKKVTFVVENVGKKSVEARKVELMSTNCMSQEMIGQLVCWDEGVCTIQVITRGRQKVDIICKESEVVGMRSSQVGASVMFQVYLKQGFVPVAVHVKKFCCKENLTGGGVNKVVCKEDVSGGMKKVVCKKNVTESREIGGVKKVLCKDEVSGCRVLGDIKKVKDKDYVPGGRRKKANQTQPTIRNFENKDDDKTNEVRPLSEETMSVKQVTSEEFSEELIREIKTMDNNMLSDLFQRQLKYRLSGLVQQPVGSKIVIAVIMREASIGGSHIQDKVTRMVMANLSTVCSSKHGSSVVQACLENCSRDNKLMIADKIVEFDSVEEFTDLWLHGSQVFTSSLVLLDETSLIQVGSTLMDNYVSLATDIRHYKPTKALLTYLANTDFFIEILPELETNLTSLACNRFGHFVVSALLENTSPLIKTRLISTFEGEIARLACHPLCHSVLVTAVLVGSPSQQATLIEEVCTVPAHQADMSVVGLTKDKFGHTVVLAMLKVSRHRQVHNLLKASILCKHEELMDNEWAGKVLTTIKTEFHNRA